MDLTQYGVEMWSEEKIRAFRHALLEWYDREKRDLPWRHTKDPYYIWVSEIMCQQTQVATVIPYYNRFLEQFPTIESLAEAPEEHLLKVWEGLGYYSRVRNMQSAAIQVMEEFGGNFPRTMEGISSLKGIGPYTAGAIGSIAFGLPEPAVDGNLMRVIARLFEVNLDIGNPSNRKVFQAIAEILIDPDRPGDFNQALMDLGADIESPVNPRPKESPVRDFSGAYLHGTMDKYPIKIPKKKPIPMKWHAFVVRNEKGEYLLEKNVQSDLLSGFWHFPLIRDYSKDPEQMELFPATVEEVAEHDGDYEVNADIPLITQFESLYRMKITSTGIMKKAVKHVFSHQKWNITLEEALALEDAVASQQDRELRWVTLKEMEQLPVSKVQSKMIEKIKKENNLAL